MFIPCKTTKFLQAVQTVSFEIFYIDFFQWTSSSSYLEENSIIFYFLNNLLKYTKFFKISLSFVENNQNILFLHPYKKR